MLSKFQIRNLRPSSQSVENQDSLVRISAPGYDATISDNPAATLKYLDEDGDKIILGSSQELIEKLEESVMQSSASLSRRKKDRMSIAMLLSEAQQNPDALKYHTFDIEEREEIQKLWQEIQRRNKTLPPPPSIGAVAEVPPIWTSEENRLLAKLRNDGLSWEAMSNKMDGRSAVACRQHYQATFEDVKHKEEDKMDKLAAAYERLKVEVWTPVAAELGISWEEAEALHWALGKDELACRAEKVQSLQDELSGDPNSMKNTDGDWQQNRKIKFKIRPSANGFPDLKFEDNRRHHLNTTKPPQLRNAVAASQLAPRFAAGKTSYAGVAKPTFSKGAYPSLNGAPAANLTSEGKRQAQAAGDILRSRTTPSRHRKAVAPETDPASHQNRWASYKSPNTAFSPKASVPASQAINVLTPEGRRQAQAAGDKLRSRTNPIRHSRPSRSGSIEHGVSKNRWASYVAPRAVRFEERYHAPGDLKDKSQCGITDVAKPEKLQLKATETAAQEQPQPKTMVTAEQKKQPSLLEVFEAELAKTFPRMDDTTNESEAPEPEIVDIPSSMNGSSSTSTASDRESAPPQEATPRQQLRPVIQGVNMIGDYIQKLTLGDREFPQNISNVVDHGVRAASGAIEALVRGTLGRLDDALDQNEQSGAGQRDADIRGIDDALNGLRGFVNNVATGLGGPNETVLSSSPGATENEDISVDSTPAALAAMPAEPHSEDAAEGSSHCGYVPSMPLDVSHSSEDGQMPPHVGAHARVLAQSSESSHAPNPGCASENRPAQHKYSMVGPSIREDGIMNEPWYHKSGPIHLPHGTSSWPLAEAAFDGFGHRDYLRHSQSITNADKPATRRIASPSPAATRFPTLAQFEDQDFTVTPSFPALPSMEPLVPQRVAPQRAVNLRGPQKYFYSDTPDLSPETSQNSKQLLVPTVAETHSSNRALEDYQMELMLNTGQDRKRMLIAKQEPDDYSTARDGSPETSRNSNVTHLPKFAESHCSNTALEDYQRELILLAEQDKKRVPISRQEPASSALGFQDGQGGGKCTMRMPKVSRPNTPDTTTPWDRALRDFEEQLTFREQRREKRELMAQEKNEMAAGLRGVSNEDRLQDQTRDGAVKRQGPDQWGNERTVIAPWEQDPFYDSPQLPGTFPGEQLHKNDTSTNAADAEKYEHPIDTDPISFPTPSSAARLARPFDPLEVEPSSQPHLTQRIRRNATVAGTDSRYNARRRRPYSEAFDGFGRVAWESFEDANGHDDDTSLYSGKRKAGRREQTMSGRGRQQRRQQQLRRSATLHEASQRSTSPFRRYDDEHQDDSTVEKINTCVKQLRDLGFGSDEDGAKARLVVYAQAAEGDLVEAIDMIDEEQRAYRGL